ncbi:MAG: ECF transporter S component [Butyrivibrio sp.]|nr:ECF transporter S component [Butyrivibrio sp.]
MKKSIATREIAITAILLAICIVSQVYKNISVYITGPVINACIILAIYTTNLTCALGLCVITPITAYFIAASPVMMAVPGIVPFIILGNCILAVSVWFFKEKNSCEKGSVSEKISAIVKSVLCAVAKAAFMGVTISVWLLPTFIPQGSPLRGKMNVFQLTFSVTQFITALIGFVYAYAVLTALRHSHIGTEAD